MIDRAQLSTCVRCDRPYGRLSRGLCTACWKSEKKAGNLHAYPLKERKLSVCSVCGGPNYSGGLCFRHVPKQYRSKPARERKDKHMGHWASADGVILYAKPKTARCALGLHWTVIGEGMVDEEPCYRVEWSYGDDWTPKEGLEILSPYQQAQNEVDAPLRCLQTARNGKCETREDDEWPI